MTITINDKHYAIPANWNALTLRQQMECYNIIMSDTGSLFEPRQIMPAKRIALVSRLLGLTDAFMSAWLKDCRDTYGPEGELVFLAELDAILQATDFLFDIEEDEAGNKLYQIRLGLTRCPWPTLSYTSKKGKKKTYYAPADELENITLYEMAMAFSIFERYLESQDEADAIELAATLYRPGKAPTKANKASGYEGDRRLPLYKHETMVKKRAARMASLPPTTRHLIVFWFASCRQQIISSFPNIFSASAAEQYGERVGNDYSWAGMLLALAGGIVHLEQVSQEPYQNGLVYLSYLEDQRKLAELRAAKK